MASAIELGPTSNEPTNIEPNCQELLAFYVDKYVTPMVKLFVKDLHHILLLLSNFSILWMQSQIIGINK